MANGIGLFLPSESAYSKPGAFEDSLRAEAMKQAAYLSSMDQFYAELDESTRQFDEQMAWSQDSFKMAADAKRWEVEEGLKVQKSDIEQRRDAADQQYALGKKELAYRDIESRRQVSAQKYGVDKQTEAQKYNIDRQMDQRESEASTSYSTQSRNLDQVGDRTQLERDKFEWTKGVSADEVSYGRSQNYDTTEFFKELIRTAQENKANKSKDNSSDY